MSDHPTRDDWAESAKDWIRQAHADAKRINAAREIIDEAGRGRVWTGEGSTKTPGGGKK